MNKKDNHIGLLKKEETDYCIKEIIGFFKEERDEDIGIIQAEEYLDFFLEKIGYHIYNKGIRDSKAFLEKRFEDMKMDIDLLQNL